MKSPTDSTENTDFLVEHESTESHEFRRTCSVLGQVEHGNHSKKIRSICEITSRWSVGLRQISCLKRKKNIRSVFDLIHWLYHPFPALRLHHRIHHLRDDRHIVDHHCHHRHRPDGHRSRSGQEENANHKRHLPPIFTFTDLPHHHLSCNLIHGQMPCMKFLCVRSDVCRQLLSDSTSRGTPLLLAIRFPLLGLVRDLHPLE